MFVVCLVTELELRGQLFFRSSASNGRAESWQTWWSVQQAADETRPYLT